MSIKLVENEIKRFLKDSSPEAICVIGKWGVGKTFTWNKYLKEAAKNKVVSLPYYSYVSLFGQGSLEELKYAIIENKQTIEEVASDSDTDFFQKLRSWKSGKYLPAILDVSKIFKNTDPIFARFLPSLIRSQIICIDDLERIGKGLETKDVLGMISFLKEQRNCKVVLLLNDEELDGEAKKDFDKQLEKVIDMKMVFDPTPCETAEIGINKENNFYGEFVHISNALGIVNIRVIKKIERLLERLVVLLKKHDERIFKAALPSVVLMGWSIYQPQIAPPLEFIKNFNRFDGLLGDKKDLPEKEKNWRLLLSSINFYLFDELDQLIYESVQRGYFDPESIEKIANDLDKKYKLQDKDASFHSAWDKYYHSFKNNGDEVLDDMYNALKSGVEAISPMNFDVTLSLFRKFGRDKQADEMIQFYMTQRNEDPEFYDPSRAIFLELKDENLKKAFKNKLESFKDDRGPKEILLKISQQRGWNPEDIKKLAQTASDHFYALFKELDGVELNIIVTQSLKFGAYGNASEEMKLISANAALALKRVGEESAINRERIRAYGINLDIEDKKESST